MADDFNFKVNPSDFRGIEHEKFRTRLLNLAITNQIQSTENGRVGKDQRSSGKCTI